MKVGSAVLAGKRALVVADEMLVALAIEDMLADQGCTILGPFNMLASALNAARTERFDLARENVYAVAEALTAQHIPFLFLSGYGDTAIPKQTPSWRVCSKRFTGLKLTTMFVRNTCGRSRVGACPAQLLTTATSQTSSRFREQHGFVVRPYPDQAMMRLNPIRPRWHGSDARWCASR